VNNLKWSFVGFQDIEDALKYETKLIKEFNPKYNRDKK
jgi:excinuclease UvrABC nuclease subunit